MPNNLPSFLTCSRLSVSREAELVDFVRELDLYPEALVTPSVARLWRDELADARFGNPIAEEKQIQAIEFMNRFHLSNHKRKPIFEDSSCQLKLNFD